MAFSRISRSAFFILGRSSSGCEVNCLHSRTIDSEARVASRGFLLPCCSDVCVVLHGAAIIQVCMPSTSKKKVMFGGIWILPSWFLTLFFYSVLYDLVRPFAYKILIIKTLTVLQCSVESPQSEERAERASNMELVSQKLKRF